MVTDALHEAETKMKEAVRALEEDLGGIRTGRASPALIEKLMVDYYGSATPLLQLASISTPEPMMLMVRPFDPGTVGAIERAIQISDLGLTPNVDGNIIRLVLPPLTKERRNDLVKVVSKRVEEAKVSIRNGRRETLDDLREFEKEKLISEDEMHRGRDELQKLTDHYTSEVDQIGQRKEQEILAL